MPRNGCDTNVNGECQASGGSGGGGAAANTGGAAVNDGCIYPDEVIIEKGVTFDVRYTGCVEVRASMKSLDFATRTLVARECINRVCEAAGLKSAGKRRVDKKIIQYIADRPCMKNAGTNVTMKVSSRAFDLVSEETGELIASHNMPRISFASGGDSDTIDFVAYIAKNEDDTFRACYVVECIGGQSGDLIVTIGKAFMLRYNALSKKTSAHKKAKNPPYNYNLGKENDKDYYNDLPDKLPPDLLTDDDIQQQQQQLKKPQQQLTRQQQDSQIQTTNKQLTEQKLSQLNLKKPRERLSSNLIDLNSPPPDQTTNKYNLNLFDPMKATENTEQPTVVQPRDVFDMQPFSVSAEVQRSQLMTESWFHPGISRPIAESLLITDGDFLVRESQGKQNQYVLTGLEGKNPKHLLLIDPEGVVRTKDRIFDSISHLINYHWTNSLPIISEDSELVLRNPVMRPGLTTNATQSNQQSLQQKKPTKEIT